MAPVLRLGGVTEPSTVDWYGNVSAVVFFAGCNLRCVYCQNSPLIPRDSGRDVPLEWLRDRLETSRTILDSVVLTGGEPTLQPEAAHAAAQLAHNLGLKVMLNTNGTLWEPLDLLLRSGLIDRVALDIKAPLRPEPTAQVTGRPETTAAILINTINHCLNLTKELGIEMEARTTVAPGVSDDPHYIAEIATNIKGRTNAYYLQQYDNQGPILDPNLKLKPPPTRDAMLSLAHTALNTGLREVYIKTRVDGLEKVG